MATTRRSKRVLCPLYLNDSLIEISCEGFMDSAARVTVSFKNKATCEQHLELFCDKDYCCCEVYRMVMAAKYDDDAPSYKDSRYVSTFADRRGPRPSPLGCKGSLGHKNSREMYVYYTTTQGGDDMSLKANHDLRIYTADAGVYLWQVAQAYGKSYTTLNNWLRKELDDKSKAEFKTIVDKIAGEK